MPSVARFFFYGTLRDAAVRRRVFGADIESRITLTPAAAPGWRAVYACGHPFPILVPGAGGDAPGCLAEGLDPLAVRRLVAYENSGYRVGRIGVVPAGRRCCAVSAFLPTRALRPSAAPWDLEEWYAAWHAVYMRRLGQGPR